MTTVILLTKSEFLPNTVQFIVVQNLDFFYEFTTQHFQKRLYFRHCIYVPQLCSVGMKIVRHHPAIVLPESFSSYTYMCALEMKNTASKLLTVTFNSVHCTVLVLLRLC